MALVQLLVWWLIFRPAFTADVPYPTSHEPVSVIVCFRNEADTLDECLLAILEQSYPNFEVLAVDDNSTDGSAALVSKLAIDHPNLRLLSPGPTRPGKKDALTYGIQQSRYDFVLLTDADCTPASSNWITHMVAPLGSGQELVLGASPYRFLPGWLNRWQRFEATYVALQYLGLARSGVPYMGVGRNLAYHKDFFGRARGFAQHRELPGGDDDLLVGANARRDKTALVTHPHAWTWSHARTGLGAYLRQKLRHQSVGTRYRFRDQLLLLLLALNHGLFHLLWGYLLLTTAWYWAVGVGGIRALSVLYVYLRRPAADFSGGAAGNKIPPVRVLLFDFLYAPFSLFLGLGTLLPARRW